MRVSREEAIRKLIEYGYESEDISILFAYNTDHQIELDKHDKLRWVQTVNWQKIDDVDGETAKLPHVKNPNEMIIKHHNHEITQREHMDYSRDIGYSLYGYWELYISNDRFNHEQYEDEAGEPVMTTYRRIKLGQI